MKTFKYYGGRAAASLAILAATGGYAMAAVDTSAVTTAISEGAAALALIGAAWIAMRYGAAVWKWMAKFTG